MPIRASRRLLNSLPIAFALSISAAPALAQEGLMVAPTRLVFEGRQRSAEVTLLNNGASVSTYRITFVQMRMREDGTFEEVDTARMGEQFADGLIRYSPRQVRLEPHVPQTIRLQLRLPAGLASGEYRSHLLFRVVPSPAADGPAEPATPGAPGLDIRLTPIYAISIPIIVRHGETAVSAALSDLELRRSAAGDGTLHFALRREGTRSLYGDLTVRLVSTDGRKEIAGVMRKVAVYTPNGVRRFGMPLASTIRPGPGDRLEVSFTPSDGRPPTSAELRLP